MPKLRAPSWLLLLLLIAVASVRGTALFQQSTPSDLLKVAESLVGQTAKIRMLEPTREIQKGVKTRQEISEYLAEQVRADYPEEELSREGNMLKKLGLLPGDMDYKNFTLGLLTEQVSGFYDPDKKTLFIAGWLPIGQQSPVMVHELTHALQDQHFDLDRMLKEERKLHNGDRFLARQAVIEGDAMAVMMDYMLLQSGKNFSQLPDLASLLRGQFSMADPQFKVFMSAPMYLKETLLFPYGYGAAFLQKAFAKSQSWSEVDRIYSDLPTSTEQLMHPEKYFGKRDDPKLIEAEDPGSWPGHEWKSRYKNVLGEFSIFLMLRLFLPEERAARAAAGWGGDQVLFVENNAGGRSAVIDASIWDSPEEADEFYQALIEWCRLKYPAGVQKSTGSAEEFTMTVPGECQSVMRRGATVCLALGFTEAELANLKR